MSEQPQEDRVSPWHIEDEIRAGRKGAANKLLKKAMQQNPNMSREKIIAQTARHSDRWGRQPLTPDDIETVLTASKKTQRPPEQREADREKLKGQATENWETLDPSIPRSDVKALEAAGHIETRVSQKFVDQRGRWSSHYFGGVGQRKVRYTEFRRGAGLEEEPPSDPA